MRTVCKWGAGEHQGARREQDSSPRVAATPRPGVQRKRGRENSEAKSCSSGHCDRSSGPSLPASGDLEGKTSR